MNRENMLLLAEYLETSVKVRHFNMAVFRNSQFFSVNECGTSGCALGWAPLVPGLEAIDSDFYCYDGTGVKVRGSLSWDEYGARIFELDDDDDMDSSIWAFLFSEDWQTRDNSPVGAGQRLRWMANPDNDIKTLEGFDADFPDYKPHSDDIETYST